MRQRREDIPALANHFLRRFAAENRRAGIALTPQALDVLVNYHWPGNVRQLENVIERSVVLCQEDSISPELFPQEVLAPHAEAAPQLPLDGLDLKGAVNGYTRALIETSLARCGGVQRRAAQMLRVSPSTLNEMIRRLRIAAGEEDSRASRTPPRMQRGVSP